MLTDPRFWRQVVHETSTTEQFLSIKLQKQQFKKTPATKRWKTDFENGFVRTHKKFIILE